MLSQNSFNCLEYLVIRVKKRKKKLSKEHQTFNKLTITLN